MGRVAWLGLVLAVVPATTEAATRRYTLARVLTAPVPADDGYFGFALGRYGADLLVSAPSEASPDAAAVYRIAPATGAVVQTYAAPANAAHEFGLALATVGDTIVVGAPAQTGGVPAAGAAYVFDAATGALLRTLTNPGAGSEFGYAVAALGGNVLVSARTYGDVHLFDGTTGAWLRTYENPGFPTDSFGSSLAGLGSDVIVGAPGAVRLYSGVAYRFDGTTGALLRTYTNPTPDAEDGFGQVVGTLGGDVLVGDPYDGTGLPSAGQVHRFDPTTGALRQTYQGPGGALGTFGYGAVVDLDGDLLAGAPGDRTAGMAAGAAYLLDGSTADLRARFLPPDPADALLAGYTVGAAGTYVAMAAPYADGAFDEEGRVYLFDPCGSGVVEGDEECDDGNTTDGDGCSSLCFVEPCTSVPPSGCSTPAIPRGSALSLKDGGIDTLAWRWGRGAATLAQLGDPTSTSHYELCVYDGSAAAQPRFARVFLAGEVCGKAPCWRARPGKGFVFKNTRSAPGGIAAITLTAGADRAARIAIKGKSADLAVPPPPLVLPVIAQLHNVETGACWAAAFSQPTKNEAGRFSARSD